ncbi:zinc finger SWIM domain-containing protein 7-like [Phlebotomus papatasi]|uniref:zinc finger SWIM domain-containing protein 7-like n=1 Tax=Phlebotomus papatasi TaxID=29031 RepID=UPI002483CED4|nr:zinc finger SWIM domain-containing protein 7-like [Phlebotomus papatasi]
MDITEASTIIFSVRDNILKELDRKYWELKKAGISSPIPIPREELRLLEILYGDTLNKAVDILKERRIKPCKECPHEKGIYELQQFKIQGSKNNVYHLAENAMICRCQAFKHHFFTHSKKFQCKHILALALMKFYYSDYTPTVAKKF